MLACIICNFCPFVCVFAWQREWTRYASGDVRDTSSSRPTCGGMAGGRSVRVLDWDSLQSRSMNWRLYKVGYRATNTKVQNVRTQPSRAKKISIFKHWARPPSVPVENIFCCRFFYRAVLPWQVVYPSVCLWRWRTAMLWKRFHADLQTSPLWGSRSRGAK